MQPARADLTVRELVSRYLRHVKADNTLAPDALVHRERTLADFVGCLGDTPVADLRAHHLYDWIDDHPDWRPGTKKLRAGEIKAVFGWAYDQERIDRHPFRRVRYAGSERRPAMPDDVLERLILAASPSFANVLRFLRMTACRIGELCNARWPDVDLERGIWTIPKHKGRRATKKPKVLPLTGEAVDLLRTIKSTVAARNAASACRRMLPPDMPTATDVIFLNSHLTPWRTAVCRQCLGRLRRRLGIKGYSLHGIRHCAATAAVRGGVPLKYVSLMLGHSSTAITEDFYVHCQDDLSSIRAAAEAARPEFSRHGGDEGNSSRNGRP